ncbi:LOW QUALITY PROTEIN: vertnin [Onychomys torridus]|uniref:LOW QUALITY PROTEIN: vertnin n=1 Tax=Onychomys torridus TaxID=38674 RepID=UPI00167F81E5|nr:LOW QUALITY PROTEIN: vertnin [Onychomys torridus]
MTSRDQLVQQVLRDLQEAVESEGLQSLTSAAVEAKQVLSSFTLPICQKGGPGPQVLEVDSVALSLYPEDAPQNMLPLVCKGEGSLLFEAASMLLWGHAGLSLELRARTVVEMLLHRHYYLQGMIDSKVMLQAVRYSLCSEESPEMTNLSSATLEAIFDADVKATCFPTSFSNVWHLYALASILQRNIYSIYPMRNVKIRPYFNRVIRPRRCTHATSMLHIMWAGQPLADHLFRHQYFAPVVGLEEVEADGPATLNPISPVLGSLRPPAETLELLNREPGLSYSHLCDRSGITKSTFYRWRRQTQEHRQKVATRFSAKHFLQDSFYRGGLVPLQQFLQRFPEISRSTYYAWKHELLGSGADSASVPAAPPREALAGPELESLPGKKAAEGLGCSSLAAAVSSPSVIFMQRAKSYLEHCISLNKLVPYRCFKCRFPGISRSTYYNWRRKALRRSPSFKLAPAPATTESLPPTDVGDRALLSLKDEVGEEGTGKAVVGEAPPVSQGLVSTRMPLSRWQRRLRRAARKQVLSGHLPFCRFRLRYPSLSPSTFWVWKSRSRGWARVQASSLGRRGQEPDEGQEMEAVKKVTSVVAPQAETLPGVASSENTPADAQGGPSREGVIQETPVTQGQPHSGFLSSQTVAAATGGRDGQVLVMDMLTTTRFKAQAKLFLQKRFQSKTFPSYKEFQALFPLTARSTYYMWKRALFEGLTLVDG